jgi:3-methyladenine DNA glycosylase AlkC
METKRTGARSRAEIAPEVLDLLNLGQLASANLVEWLAVDQVRLLQNVLAQAQRPHLFPAIGARVAQLKKPTVNQLNEAIGLGLQASAHQSQDLALLPWLVAHPADMVRCWAAYAVGRPPQPVLAEVLAAIRPLAADEHFGVREVAWMAVRPLLAAHLLPAIGLLAGWAQAPEAYLRRFASEATRPRGVWCAHIEDLKAEPALGLPILEPLRSDPARYVQDSVANWLNDAGKTAPTFVRQLCDRWEAESPTPETAYILKRARRNL